MNLVLLATIVVAIAAVASASHARAPKIQAPESDLPCVLCGLVVGELEKLLAQNATVSKIETDLENICNDLPKAWGGECTDLVENYLPQLIAELENNLPPSEVCAKVGLCSSAAAPRLAVPAKVASPESVECSICQIVAKAVEKGVANNNTESEIEEELEKVCSYTPWKKSCDQIVEEYLPQIIQAIEENESPTQLCAEIDLCPSAVAAPEDECSICELIVGEIESLLENNSTQQDIETELAKVCALLPGGFAATCTALVDSYLPQLIQHVEQDFPPNVACQKIGVCSSAAAPAPKAINAETPCSACELVVAEAEKLIAGKTLNNTEIEDKLKALCLDIPKTYQPECTLVVTAFLPTILADLESGKPAAQVCTDLHLCKSAAPAQRTVRLHPRKPINWRK